jgi:hypothetical protein
MLEVMVIATGADRRSASSCMYYPLWFACFVVSWRRIMMSRRADEIWVCVDGVRGVPQLVDALPNISRESVEPSEVMPLGISREDALEKAGGLARWWARTKLFTLWSPAVEQKELALLHKVYLVEKGPAGAMLLDSVSGERDLL